MKACEFWTEENDPLLEIAKSFSAIGPQHPFFPHICRFRSLLADDRVRSEMQENTGDSHDGQVSASLTARFSPDQRWELKRICWSWQIHEEFIASRERKRSWFEDRYPPIYPRPAPDLSSARTGGPACRWQICAPIRDKQSV